MSGAGHCLGDFIVMLPKGNQEVHYVLIEVYLKGNFALTGLWIECRPVD